MKRKIELIGGPWDGMTRTLNDPPDWVWLEGELGRDKAPRCYRSCTPDRMPYHAVATARSAEEQRVERRTSYLYAGHSHRVCDGCGAFHAVRDEDGQRVDACTLCGHPFGEMQAA